MLCILLLFTIFVASQGFISDGDVIIPCKSDDNGCMMRSANMAVPKILTSVPLLRDSGVDSSDPLKADFLEVNLPILQAKFFNNTITGYSKCNITKMNLSLKAATLRMQVVCPTLKMVGNYEINGNLVLLPVEGKGAYLIESKTYLFNLAAEILVSKDDNGIKHMSFTNIKSTAKPLQPIYFHFGNLFNGNKQLSDAVHKFAHDNYEAVAELTQTPIYSTNIRAIFSNVNKYLKTIPLDDLFVK